jgi:predicted nucleic acid-binding Zn ribbon protein
MPVYEFRCAETGETREFIFAVGEIEDVGENFTQYENGQDLTWRRRYTPPAGIHFHGSGWASKGG